MGYRNYIGVISKEEYDKIKNLTTEELYKMKNEDPEDGYVNVREFSKELYEFGKYCDFQTKKYVKPFFTNKELNKRYNSDGELYIVTKSFLEKIIENYTEKIRKYYLEMLTPFFEGVNNTVPCEFLNTVKTEYSFPNNKHTFDFTKITPEQQSALFKIIDHVRSFSMEWGIASYFKEMKPYDLKDGSEVITTSWKYEYGLFEIIRIYKSFDWKNNIMIYYGG